MEEIISRFFYYENNHHSPRKLHFDLNCELGKGEEDRWQVWWEKCNKYCWLEIYKR